MKTPAELKPEDIPGTYAFHVRHKNGWGSGFGPSPTHCSKCGAALPVKPDTGGTGYGCGTSEPIAAHVDAPELKPGETLERSPAVCYTCCADDDRREMIETGRAVLYLTQTAPAHVSNWPGSLSFPVPYISRGRHNIAGRRYDFSFTGPDGKEWRGTQYGDNTQIAHCRRVKGRA